MSQDIFPHQMIALIGITVSLVGVYLSDLPVIGTITSLVAVYYSVVLGANTLRYVAKYSLGTGVPSIVYILSAISLVSVILSTLLSLYMGISILLPVMAVLLSLLMALVLSLTCKKVFSIDVDILTKSFILIAISATLSMTAMTSLVLSTYNPLQVYHHMMTTGLIVLPFILTTMAIQNPYNSSMGPNEEQHRTLSLTASNTFLYTMILSVVSILFNTYWWIALIISLALWLVFWIKYLKDVKHQAASIKYHGLWSKNDDGDYDG